MGRAGHGVLEGKGYYITIQCGGTPCGDVGWLPFWVLGIMRVIGSVRSGTHLLEVGDATIS